MEFKIRAINWCNIGSAFSKEVLVRIPGKALERTCNNSYVTQRASEKVVDDDYDARVANAVHHFWSSLLEQKE